jgi:TPR repeat protein
MGSPSACSNAAADRTARLAATPPGLRATQSFLRQRTELLKEHRKICNAGQGLLPSCAALGAMFSDPRLGVANRDSARHYYRLGCIGTTLGVRGMPRPGGPLGVGEACRGLADLALAANPLDTAIAHRLYRIGCELFDAESCVARGRTLPTTDEKLYQFVSACIALEASAAGCEAAGAAFERELGDTTQAKRFYRRACDLGNGPGCSAAGRVEQGARGDSAAVLRYYRQGCMLGAGSACVGLGEVLAERFDDHARAERLMRRGCELGSAAGCWRAMLAFIQAGDEENSAVYRTAACRLSRAYCKRANSAGVEPEP